MRVRPSDPTDDHHTEDLPVSVNASKEGIYFASRKAYYKGMRVFVIFAFSSAHDPMNCDYVGEVVLVEDLPNGKFGAALHLKMSMNYSESRPGG